MENIDVHNLARDAAERIVAGFGRYHDRFTDITRQAGARFRERAWLRMRDDAGERLSLYGEMLDRVVADLRALPGEYPHNRDTWAKVKTAYAKAINSSPDQELAETWFNSVTRRIFSTVGVEARIEFTAQQVPYAIPAADTPVYRTYRRARVTVDLFKTILKDYSGHLPFHDLDNDARMIAGRVESHLVDIGALRLVERIEMVNAVFFRGMGAYLVGRLYSGSHVIPLVVAVLHGPEGIFTDAVLLCEKDMSILFSFTRSSFHVDIERPFELVRFLKQILPRKKKAEIYMAIGYHKHGKTELYRDIREHLAYCCGERFEMAPGQRGMVMEVFGMPNYDIVFKMIKDRFAYPKTVTRKEVMEKYELVFRHDRAGRLVEAQSFEYLSFDPCCFSSSLLSELQQSTGTKIHVNPDRITVDHAYVERRVIPLDIFLKEADPDAARSAVIDFGNAIKDLAKSNIFPGDFLLKNFGITRHGRVVFYDYDELCLLTECRFRKIPRSRTDEDELSLEPWYYVGDNDVFPEEFKNFMGLGKALMGPFMTYHSDLFQVDFWQQTRQAILSGHLCHIFPYPADRRFNQPSEAICELWDAGCRN